MAWQHAVGDWLTTADTRLRVHDSVFKSNRDFLHAGERVTFEHAAFDVKTTMQWVRVLPRCTLERQTRIVIRVTRH